MVAAGFYAYRNKYPVGERMKISTTFRYFVYALPSLFLLIVVIGGIIAGIFTATEASAIAVLYAFILSVVIYREIKLKELTEILLNAAKTTSIVLLLIGTSMAMSWAMSIENIPRDVSLLILSVSDNKIIVLLIINLILLAVGVFMDITPAVLIFTPIFLPVVTRLGVDPVHFGIIMVLNLCIGLCTPPVGSVLFVGCSVAKIGISEVIRPLLPLFAVMILALLMVTFIPPITLWLPKIFGF